jgi:dihydroorotase/N-acyl-D-amino-acid deacylase
MRYHPSHLLSSLQNVTAEKMNLEIKNNWKYKFFGSWGHGRPRPRISILAVTFAALLTANAQQPTYDVIISGARIVDGTGAAWHYGDIAIKGDRISAMGNLHDAAATQHIDARGLVVSPGFIDVQGQSEFNILVDGRAASKITQGVTTEISGEGTSIAPVNDRLLEDLRPGAEKYHVDLDWRSLDEYFQHFQRARPAINFGTFVGAGGLREYVIGKITVPQRLPSSSRCASW